MESLGADDDLVVAEPVELVPGPGVAAPEQRQDLLEGQPEGEEDGVFPVGGEDDVAGTEGVGGADLRGLLSPCRCRAVASVSNRLASTMSRRYWVRSSSVPPKENPGFSTRCPSGASNCTMSCFMTSPKTYATVAYGGVGFFRRSRTYNFFDEIC